MTVRAILEDGVFKPKTPLPLREHEEVEIDVKRFGEASPVADDDPTGWEAAQRFIGLWKDAPRRSDGPSPGITTRSCAGATDLVDTSSNRFVVRPGPRMMRAGT